MAPCQKMAIRSILPVTEKEGKEASIFIGQKKEVMEPEIKGLGERSAKDQELEKDMGAMDQRSPGDVTSPDIDG